MLRLHNIQLINAAMRHLHMWDLDVPGRLYPLKMVSVWETMSRPDTNALEPKDLDQCLTRVGTVG